VVHPIKERKKKNQSLKKNRLRKAVGNSIERSSSAYESSSGGRGPEVLKTQNVHVVVSVWQGFPVKGGGEKMYLIRKKRGLGPGPERRMFAFETIPSGARVGEDLRDLKKKALKEARCRGGLLRPRRGAERFVGMYYARRGAREKRGERGRSARNSNRKSYSHLVHNRRTLV